LNRKKAMKQISIQRSKVRSVKTWVATAAILLSALGAGSAFAEADNVVLVHGMNMDGSGWRPVYDILTGRGYNVSIVQQPLNGFENDVTATQRILDQQEGPVVLVGHSYGGVVITTAGNDPKVESLVYVAGFQPDSGETTGLLNEQFAPLLDPAAVAFSADGYVTISEAGFAQDIAPDLTPADAQFLFASQVPTTTEVFMAATAEPAWRHKPSFAVVATEDRVINPQLQRWMYERSGSHINEVSAGHMLYMSQPEVVADVIIRAATLAVE
ncbi:MAG: alpha/beta hydrolase, partial [Natronospirillum sp.]